MRILTFSWEYPPLLYGGLGRHVHELSEAQARAGHDVVVVTQSHPDAPDDSRVNGVRVVRTAADASTTPDMGTDFVGWATAFDAAYSSAAASTLADWRPEVVHAHDWLVAQASVDTSRVRGVPLVTTIHGTAAGQYGGDLSKPRTRARHEVEAWLVDQSDSVIVISSAMRDEVSTYLQVEANDLTVVPSGVDADRWASTPAERSRARDRLGIAHDAPLLALPARLKAHKGGDTAVEALRLVHLHHPDAHLVFAGAGDYGDALKALAASHGLSDHVHFTGQLGDRELAALMGTATVVPVPSRYEPFGLVPLEAAAAGTPVVAAATGGLRESVIDDRTGIQVPPGDAEALATATVRLIDEPQLADRLAIAAGERVRTVYAWPAVAGMTTVAYSGTIDAPVRPSRSTSTRRHPATTLAQHRRIAAAQARVTEARRRTGVHFAAVVTGLRSQLQTIASALTGLDDGGDLARGVETHGAGIVETVESAGAAVDDVLGRAFADLDRVTPTGGS